MLKGIIPAVVTPFRGDNIDFTLLESLLNFLIDRGVNGLFIAGTNGEGPLLSKEEKAQLFKSAVEIVKGRVPVIAQIGEITTKDTIEVGESAVKSGVSAVAIVSPYYFKLEDPALKKHFISVARALMPIPTYLYNLPSNTGNNIKPSLAKAIMESADNVKGIKDSSKDLQTLEDFIYELGQDRDVIVGTDSLILPALIMGAKGAISALANPLPELCVGLYRDFLSGDLESAKEKQYILNNIRTITKQFSSISALKVMLRLRGIDVGSVRPPLGEVNAEQEGILKEILEDLNYL
ncbi:MAG: dihydrodipicolinate synthase family protein [bacterium]|nr:dihydrodipicolinate synthase family protein [bacterium]